MRHQDETEFLCVVTYEYFDRIQKNRLGSQEVLSIRELV